MAVLPAKPQVRIAAGDIFAGAVERRADRMIRRRLRPIGGEDVVGLAPQQQLEGRREQRRHRLLRGRIGISPDPAAILEAAAGILIRPAWRLHDAVGRQFDSFLQGVR